MSKLIINCNGGARGNPGPAAAAFVVKLDEKEIHSESKYLGSVTNNVAEYFAVIIALDWLIQDSRFPIPDSIHFILDSELIVRQINGVYKVKDIKLKKLHGHVAQLLKKIDKNAFYFNIVNPNLSIKGRFDTIIAINVLEHIYDDIGALRNIHNLLPDNGTFIILVPAHMILFGSYDKAVGHYRRYSKNNLVKKLKGSGFYIKKIKYYNKLSAFGWFINARLFKRKRFPRFQLTIMKLLVPFLDFFDKLVPFDFGISIVCIASKSSSKIRNGT